MDIERNQGVMTPCQNALMHTINSLQEKANTLYFEAVNIINQLNSDIQYKNGERAHNFSKRKRIQLDALVEVDELYTAFKKEYSRLYSLFNNILIEYKKEWIFSAWKPTPNVISQSQMWMRVQQASLCIQYQQQNLVDARQSLFSPWTTSSNLDVSIASEARIAMIGQPRLEQEIIMEVFKNLGDLFYKMRNEIDYKLTLFNGLPYNLLKDPENFIDSKNKLIDELYYQFADCEKNLLEQSRKIGQYIQLYQNNVMEELEAQRKKLYGNWPQFFDHANQNKQIDLNESLTNIQSCINQPFINRSSIPIQALLIDGIQGPRPALL